VIHVPLICPLVWSVKAARSLLLGAVASARPTLHRRYQTISYRRNTPTINRRYRIIFPTGETHLELHRRYHIIFPTGEKHQSTDRHIGRTYRTKTCTNRYRGSSHWRKTLMHRAVHWQFLLKNKNQCTSSYWRETLMHQPVPW
jgi:hypothetical protein